MQRLLLSALFSAALAGAQTPTAYFTYAQPCDTVRPAALAYFQQRGMPLTAAPTCHGCFQGDAKHLQDEAGHHLLSNRKAIERYTTNDLRYEKVGPLTQIVHWDLRAHAALRLLPVGNTCQADLHFTYAWYGAELVLGFPVDGDPSHGDSNGKLEAAYLGSLQHQVSHDAFAQR